MRKYKLRLNASKCSFGVDLGKFLGYMVTHYGIEVNLDKIKAINDLQPPWNLKEVQKLIGITATLNRFISRSADRCKPFSNSYTSGKVLNGVKNVPGLPFSATHNVQA